MAPLPAHRCGLGSIPGPGVTSRLRLLFVLVPAQRVSPGSPVFSPSTKTKTPNSNSICAFDYHVMLKCALQVFKCAEVFSLFIIL